MNTTECLASTFRNISGGMLRTSVFAPHGREMAKDEEVSYLGSPTEIVTRGRSPSHCSRALKGLEAALKNDLLEIVKTPNPVLYDVTQDLTKMLKMNNGELYGADPCWIGYATSSQFSS